MKWKRAVSPALAGVTLRKHPQGNQMYSDSSIFLRDVQTCDTPLTSVAYFETGTETGSFELSVHADMLKIRARRPAGASQLNHTGGIRGRVSGLSKASRKRMIEFMSSVRHDGSLLFTTITYPDIFPLDSSAWHRHFEAFRDRFENHYAKHRALWRIELIDRKSGENTGVIAPHWHLLIFLPKLDRETLEIEASLMQTEMRQWWYEIVNSGDEKHLLHGVDVAPVRSRKHAYAYVSKYIAKTSIDGLEVGRRWGRIGKFDNGESIKVSLRFDDILILRRLIKRWMRGNGKKYYRRFAR